MQESRSRTVKEHQICLGGDIAPSARLCEERAFARTFS